MRYFCCVTVTARRLPIKHPDGNLLVRMVALRRGLLPGQLSAKMVLANSHFEVISCVSFGLLFQLSS